MPLEPLGQKWDPLIRRALEALAENGVASAPPSLDRYLDERGDVIRATRSTAEALALSERLTAQEVAPGPPLSEILDELREDRV